MKGGMMYWKGGRMLLEEPASYACVLQTISEKF